MPKIGFKGGIHPTDHKAATRSAPAVRMPMPERLFVPVSQHLGAPCQPLVNRGDRVERGQIIADVDAMVSAPVHSPVTGEVVSVASRRLLSGSTALVVEILPDEHQDWDSWVLVPESDDAIAMVRAAGVVGLGGAAFPTTVKLTPPRDMPIHTLILNGCECEPFLTCDHRVMLESSDRVVA
ncbi:MAG: biotin/lipoyl-containing protein, partial [Actinomycetota bacterium]|nr:biotin/lipoyl-containing protein [Actinomycetota bacterium]